jgi:hypothetical protein
MTLRREPNRGGPGYLWGGTQGWGVLQEETKLFAYEILFGRLRGQ